MQQSIKYILILLLFNSCVKEERYEEYKQTDFKQEMQNFVIKISQYSKSVNPNFAIIPQNGTGLIFNSDNSNQNGHVSYLNAIDGQAQEGLNYGYAHIDTPSPLNFHNKVKRCLDTVKAHQKIVLVTDYCTTASNIRNSFMTNQSFGYNGFVATHLSLNNIPNYRIFRENDLSVNHLDQAKNFLYMLDYTHFSSKNDLINALKQTNYDLLILDAFFSDGTAFTPQEIAGLKQKNNGGSRKLLAYISIGEAENYRYYWRPEWSVHFPEWMEEENPNWQGNYKVKYWLKSWQEIISGNNNSYIKKLIDQGFDGAYLDLVDAYEYFEQKYN